jgi:hypothetical protein
MSEFNKENNPMRLASMIPNQNYAYQLHSLIVLDNYKSSKPVFISENTFKNNIMTHSLINNDR